MRNLYTAIIYMGVISCLFLPLGQVSQASLNSQEGLYTNYPLPVSKPSQCLSPKGKNSYAHIDKKQAAVTALGLYLGVKTVASAPTYTVLSKSKGICI